MHDTFEHKAQPFFLAVGAAVLTIAALAGMGALMLLGMWVAQP